MAKKLGKKYEMNSQELKDIKFPLKKKEFVEIRDGDVYMKLPKDFDYEQIARILLTFESPKLKMKVIEPEPEPEPESEKVDVVAEPVFDESITRCPKCNSKLKSKVIKRGNEFIRIVRCKKNKRFRKKCDFIHEFSIKI